MENTISLLLRTPHTREPVESLLDADVYILLQSQGWYFYINNATPGRPYVKIERRREGKKETHHLHRWLAFAGQCNPGHKYEVHHANFNSLDNRCDNLQVLQHKAHRALHRRPRP